jgi:uncharacterized protein YegL
MARIADGFDQFGNPEGRAFDLGGGDEDRIRGEGVLLYICNFPGPGIAEQEMRTLMAERGLQLDIRHAPASGRCTLDAQSLAGYTQLWYVSGDTPTLSGQQVQMIVDYVRSGNGLAIWADNHPYYADANLLARAVTGSSFSGNRDGDKVMVPGPADKAGRFVEHQLTQGVNNLYEGITICTIDPVPGITILGKSHDGQRCFGCFEREGQRVVLDAGFTKICTAWYHKSAGLGRYLSNIAFWLARGSRGVEYELLSPGRSEIASVKKGEESKEYRFDVAEAAATVACIVQWEGKATLAVTVRAPDGSVAGHGSSPSSPLRVTVLTPIPGTWACRVEGVDFPSEGTTYAAKVALESLGSHGGTGRRPARPSKGRVVLPFYLVCDVSAAAAGTIGDFAVALQKLKSGLTRDPAIDETVALSLITFNETARTVAPLAAPSAMELPTLSAGGGASFSAAIREYHRAFEEDRARLKADGAQVFRPCVFFLAHGAPKERYQETFRSVLGFDSITGQGNRAHPRVIAIGLPGVTRESLAGLAYPDFGDPAQRGRWFVTDPAPTALDGYRPMVQIIYRTITATHATAAHGAITFTPPTSISGTQSAVAGA